MYTYIKSEARLWTAGYYDPSGNWQPESDHDTKEEVVERVAWLNGGHKPGGIDFHPTPTSTEPKQESDSMGIIDLAHTIMGAHHFDDGSKNQIAAMLDFAKEYHKRQSAPTPPDKKAIADNEIDWRLREVRSQEYDYLIETYRLDPEKSLPVCSIFASNINEDAEKNARLILSLPSLVRETQQQAKEIERFTELLRGQAYSIWKGCGSELTFEDWNKSFERNL